MWNFVWKQMDKAMKNRITILSVFTAYICLLILLSRLLAGIFLPQYEPLVGYAVAAYFWLLYAAVIMALGNAPGVDTVAKYLMFFKGAKMLLTMVAMLVSAFILRDNAKEIIITFFVYYIALLLPESIYAAKLKKN